MNKVVDFDQILNDFDISVKSCAKQIYSDWINEHYKIFWKLQSILDELKVYLPTNSQDHNLPEELWDQLHKLFSQMITWTENIQYTTDDLSLKSLSQTWQKGFNEIQYSYPEKTKVEFSTALFKISIEDKNGLKFRKKVYAYLKDLPFRFSGSNENVRKIELHNFLVHYLEIPVTYLIFNLWQKFLNQVSDQYQDIFEKISELKEKCLFIEDFDRIYQSNQKDDFFEKIFTIAELLNKTDVILQSLYEHQNQMDEYIELEWKNIAENIEYYWQYAGTFVLPNSKFRPEVISYRKKVEEKKYRKYVDYWDEHFNSIKYNWSKNLEIFICQVKVIQIFRESVKTIAARHDQFLKPVFQNVLSSVEKEESEYKNKSVSRLAKQKLNNHPNTFFENFRNQNVPELVEAIQKTQFAETLGKFYDRLNGNNQSISTQHYIIKFPKNGNLPPKSKTLQIALRELTKNEIINPFKKLTLNQIEEIKLRIGEIIRSVSEINHLYEINWDAAAKTIKSNQSGDLNEALSIIRTSLHRSKEILKKLEQESLNSLELSRDYLTKNAKQLYIAFQSLINTEQLINFNSKLKREKSQIHLRQLSNFFSRFVKIIYSKYIKHGFRKIFRLAQKNGNHSFAATESLLRSFSNDANIRLASIPAVYRRLFLTGKKSSGYFYFERKEITTHIAKCYQTWQKGNHIISALIGESGCGKTSVLNFVQNHLFSDKNVIRINFKSKILNEEDLIKILRQALQVEQLDSFEQTEEQIRTLESDCIVLLDNIHHLFIKSPDGFDLLERFLLLIQNTKHQVFWLITCLNYSWFLLDKIVQISKHIQSVFFIKSFTPDQLKEIILGRHKISGYKINFCGDMEKINPRTKHQHSKMLEDRFFKELHKTSNGNLKVAFYYWLASIESIKNDQLFIDQKFRLDSKIFNYFNDHDVFALVPFVQHDCLTAEHCGLLWRKLKHQNLLTLKRFVSYGLLIKLDDHYCLNALYYNHIKNLLKKHKSLYVNHNKSRNQRRQSKNHQIKIDIYLPAKTDTLLAEKIAYISACSSCYIDLNKNVSTHYKNTIIDGVSVLNLIVNAYVFDILYKDAFISEVTEQIFNRLFKNNIINQNDFYA